jgi:cellobiose transport system permease protein
MFLFPFYWLAVSAFKPQQQMFSLPPTFWPAPATWENFNNLFAGTPVRHAFFNSVFIAAANCLLSLFLCSLAGFAFAKYPRAPGNHALFLFVLATMMIPAAVTLIPVYVILMKLGWINTYWAMVVPGAASAFGIFWMRQYLMNNLAGELLDAARIDGCSEFGIYWRIALPIARPALAALAVMILIGSWNNLMWAFIVLRTDDMQTLPLLIYLLQDELHTPFGMLMAAGFIATLPLVVAFLFFQRHFISGLSAGAIKA